MKNVKTNQCKPFEKVLASPQHYVGSKSHRTPDGRILYVITTISRGIYTSNIWIEVSILNNYWMDVVEDLEYLLAKWSLSQKICKSLGAQSCQVSDIWSHTNAYGLKKFIWKAGSKLNKN